MPERARQEHLQLLISGLCLLCLDRVGPADGKAVGLSAEGPDLGVGGLVTEQGDVMPSASPN